MKFKDFYEESGALDFDWIDRLERRLEDLAKFSEEESITIQLASLYDLCQFIGRTPDLKYPDIVVTNEGYLRAIWKGDEDKPDQISLTFLGNSVVEYVVLPKIRWTAFCGVRELEYIGRVIVGSGLQNIVFKSHNN